MASVPVVAPLCPSPFRFRLTFRMSATASSNDSGFSVRPFWLFGRMARTPASVQTLS